MSSTASNSEYDPTPTWVDYFKDEPRFEELKHALFVNLYKQFGVDAEVIVNENRIPILTAVVNYEGQMPDVRNNHEALQTIYDNNLLLRTLAVVRGLDYLYRKINNNIETNDRRLKSLINDYCEFIGLVEELHTDYKHEPIEVYSKKTEELESKFNAKLTAFLKKYILDNLEIEMPDSAELKSHAKILAHIRYLSSMLDPAMGMDVIYNDLKNDSKVTFNIIPITIKTKNQKRLINAQKDPKTVINWISIQFNPLLVQDNTQLPALTRYTHLHTLKNGFIVSGCFEKNGQEKRWWFTRSATLAYVGTECDENQLAQSFQENVEQIRLNLMANGITEERMPIELLMLTTDFPIDANVEIKATRRTKAHINPDNTPNVKLSEMPINFIGTTFYKGKLDGEDVPRTFGNKLERAEQGAVHVFKCLDQGRHAHIQCASGLDRTEMLLAKANMWMMQGALYHLTGVKMDLDEFENMYRLGLIGPMLAHLIRNGSMGLKPKTMTSNWQGLSVPLNAMRKMGFDPTGNIFKDDTNKLFYWDIADTNRERPIDENSYERLIDASTLSVKSETHDSEEDPVISHAKRAVSDLLDDPHDESSVYDFYEMLSVVEEAGPNYTNLYVALLVILCIISIAIGIICLIPSGGSSALVTVCAFVGLSLTLEYSACCLIGAGALVVGLISGLAATFLHFKQPKQSPDPEPTDSITSDIAYDTFFDEDSENSITSTT